VAVLLFSILWLFVPVREKHPSDKQNTRETLIILFIADVVRSGRTNKTEEKRNHEHTRKMFRAVSCVFVVHAFLY